MKIGMVADVHCNHEGLLVALERMGPVDELLCAGDAVYQFRFSNEVMELLRNHGARYVLGNHERVILGPWGERARSLPTVRRGALDFMASQAYDLETRVDGHRLVMFHGSPFDPRDEYIYPNSPALSRLREIEADYIILGHTHYHMAVTVSHALVINPGSCGEARDHRNGFCLSCAVLDTKTGEVTFEHFDDPIRPGLHPETGPRSTARRSSEPGGAPSARADR
jgi:putative phosphoesterase